MHPALRRFVERRGNTLRARSPSLRAAGSGILLLALGVPQDVAAAVAHRMDPGGARPTVAIQAAPSTALPSLVLPPAATAEPPQFTSLMRAGDVAMVRGEVARARTLYERAAATHPASPAAFIAAGKTYDPNVLSLLGVGGGGGLADAAAARELYERARSLGDPAADPLLAALR